MGVTADPLTDERPLRDELVARGLLVPSGVPGVYGRSVALEAIAEAIDRQVTVLGRRDGPEVLRFPPLLSRRHFEASGYLKSFPTLAGSVHAFAGDEHAHRELLGQVARGEDWTRGLPGTDVVLVPAACYPVYPTASGVLPAGGRLVDVLSYCFRHEPSDDPARLRAFQMREYVRLGEPDAVREWRARWLERALGLAGALGLAARAEDASDPFFGRGGVMLAATQRELKLKVEIVVAIHAADRPTAVMSLNYHQDHFAGLFDIRTRGGAPAHTACVGFGLERLVLAMLAAHGLDPAAWPADLRRRLAL